MALENDQAEVVQKLEEANKKVTKLTEERDGALTQLTAAQGQVTTISGERDKARTDLTAAQGQVTALTTERDDSRTELTSTKTELAAEKVKVTNLTATQADFDGKVREQLLKFGVRKEALTQPVPTKNEKGEKLSADDRVKLAKEAQAKK